MGCDKLFLNSQFVTFWKKGSGTNFWAKNLKSCVYLVLLFLLFIIIFFKKKEKHPPVSLDYVWVWIEVYVLSLLFLFFFFPAAAVVDQVNNKQCQT